MRVFLELNKDEAEAILELVKTFKVSDTEQLTAKTVAKTLAIPVKPLPEVVNYVAPAQAPPVTKEEIAKLAVQLIDLGRRDELIALLGSFNAKSIGELDPKDYSNFANFLKAKGCK